MNRYPNINKLFDLISIDNGGCSADEIENMLQLYIEDGRNLEILATGEDTEQQEVLASLRSVAGQYIVEALENLLQVAFEGRTIESKEVLTVKDGTPTTQGVYVCYVEPRGIFGICYDRKLLTFSGGRWIITNSAEYFRGKVYSWIGPLPVKYYSRMGR